VRKRNGDLHQQRVVSRARLVDAQRRERRRGRGGGPRVVRSRGSGPNQRAGRTPVSGVPVAGDVEVLGRKPRRLHRRDGAVRARHGRTGAQSARPAGDGAARQRLRRYPGVVPSRIRGDLRRSVSRATVSVRVRHRRRRVESARRRQVVRTVRKRKYDHDAADGDVEL